MIKQTLAVTMAFLACTGCGTDKPSKEHTNAAAQETKEAASSATQETRDRASSMRESASRKFDSAKEQLKAVPSAVSKGVQTAKEEVQNAAPRQNDQNS